MVTEFTPLPTFNALYGTNTPSATARQQNLGTNHSSDIILPVVLILMAGVTIYFIAQNVKLKKLVRTNDENGMG